MKTLASNQKQQSQKVKLLATQHINLRSYISSNAYRCSIMQIGPRYVSRTKLVRTETSIRTDHLIPYKATGIGNPITSTMKKEKSIVIEAFVLET